MIGAQTALRWTERSPASPCITASTTAPPRATMRARLALLVTIEANIAQARNGRLKITTRGQ